ncbi:MAG: hypothetical protein A4E34_00386 [Methanoregula sp. PtaU1.Bin006]|nr:MAG: hypothetical protein A4E33_01561 [Methanoregula sp. PtaB.Bin085]OPY36208.1 MAG: hypothetical protein A4E34_00386 [Methanoregula sp. PtaU1.Bin006]
MCILGKCLRPHWWLILAALIFAGISQLLNLIDPLIFENIIHD